MSIHSAAATALFLFGTTTSALAQNSGAPSGVGSAGAPGAPATVGVSPPPAPTPGQSISIRGNTPGAAQGVAPTPAPKPGQSISVPGNTPGAPQGVGPPPAPTPRQSISIPGRRPPAIGSAASRTPGSDSISIPGPRPPVIGSADPSASTLPVQPPRQGRMRNARKPTTAGSGFESPSRPECFVTPNILHEPGSGRKKDIVDPPPVSPSTGRPAVGPTRC